MVSTESTLFSTLFFKRLSLSTRHSPRMPRAFKLTCLYFNDTLIKARFPGSFNNGLR